MAFDKIMWCRKHKAAVIRTVQRSEQWSYHFSNAPDKTGPMSLVWLPNHEDSCDVVMALVLEEGVGKPDGVPDDSPESYEAGFIDGFETGYGCAQEDIDERAKHLAKQAQAPKPNTSGSSETVQQFRSWLEQHAAKTVPRMSGQKALDDAARLEAGLKAFNSRLISKDQFARIVENGETLEAVSQIKLT